MVTFTQEASDKEFTPIEDGEFVGELIEVLDQTFQFGATIKFTFKILGGEFNKRRASIFASPVLKPGWKLDTILRALGIEPLQVGAQLDSESLKGKRAKIYVESYKKDDKTFNKITKVKLLKNPAVISTEAVAVSVPVVAAQPVQAPVRAPVAPVVVPVQKPAGIPITHIAPVAPVKSSINIVDDIDFDK